MAKLLEETIERLRKMPDVVQELAARRLIQHVDQLPEPDELTAIAEGRQAIVQGELTSLDDWRHDMEIGDR